MVEQRTVAQAEKAPEDKPRAQKEHFVTFGEKVHKWATYLSIDWGLNYMTGVGFAMWGEYTKLGQKLWAGPLEATATYISKNIFKLSGAGLEHGVRNSSRFASVIAGGMFTIPPLMILESKKVRKSIVQWLDKKHYGEEVIQDDPRFAETYAAMDESHKQGFWTGLISRLGALAPLLASVWIPPLKKATHSQDYLDWVQRGSANVYSGVGLTKERLFKGHDVAEQDKRWKFLHENSAMDFGLEPIYAVLHMIFYRGLAKLVGKEESKVEVLHDEHKEERLEKKEAKLKETEAKLELKEAELKKKEGKPTTTVAHISRETHQAQVAAMSAIEPSRA